MNSLSALPFLVHVVLAGSLTLHILYRRLEVSTALAWIVVLIAMPIAGPILYVLFGNHTLGRRRQELGQRIRTVYQTAYAITGTNSASLQNVPDPFSALATSIAAESGFPVLARNTYAFLTDASEILERMREDIDGAQFTCSLEFYIIDPRGRAETVLNAVIEAAKRGVTCKVLADDFGSKPFFRSGWPKQLRAAGVSVVRSLPVGLLNSISKRTDLRNHRKVLICDRAVAYTGSFNLIDPLLFKSSRHVGHWIDVMMRIEGEMVDALTCAFNADFLFEEAGSDIGKTDPRPLSINQHKPALPAQTALMQLLPSGPEMRQSTIYEFIVAAIFNARRRVRIVTPYFIPDQAVLLALKWAAKRGVAIQIIAPEKLDTRLGQYASQASYEDLLSSGVEILLFTGGLLHTKAMLIDEDVAVFGTVNMDARSFYLNLELSVLAYEAEFVAALDSILDTYASRSIVLDESAWSARAPSQRFLENLMRLAAPVL